MGAKAPGSSCSLRWSTEGGRAPFTPSRLLHASSGPIGPSAPFLRRAGEKACPEKHRVLEAALNLASRKDTQDPERHGHTSLPRDSQVRRTLQALWGLILKTRPGE